MKKIGFMGLPCEDVVMHLARYMESIGISVAVSNSGKRYAYSEIPYINEVDTEAVEVMLGNADAKPGTFDEWDKVCFITDMQPANARSIARLKGDDTESDRFVCVVRDTIKNERAFRYIKKLLHCNENTVKIEEEMTDFIIRCGIQEGINYNFRTLSRGMRKGIIELAKTLGIEKCENKEKGRTGKWEKLLGFIHRRREKDM